MFYQCCIYINSSTLIINAATILNKIEPQVEFLLIFFTLIVNVAAIETTLNKLYIEIYFVKNEQKYNVM